MARKPGRVKRASALPPTRAASRFLCYRRLRVRAQCVVHHGEGQAQRRMRRHGEHWYIVEPSRTKRFDVGIGSRQGATTA